MWAVLRRLSPTIGADFALLRLAHFLGPKMASGWHFREGATPTPNEVAAMVAVLEGRHGFWAADVAEFFSTLHSLKGDAGRSWAWATVAEMVRRRAEARESEQNN
jgi:hypothetical protein